MSSFADAITGIHGRRTGSGGRSITSSARSRHDPLYAAAWAGLGDAYCVMAYYGMAPPADLYPKAKAAALKAIELDAELADPYVTLAVYALFWGWNWKEATDAFETAIRLNPQLARAHLLYSLVFSTTGKHDEALRLARLARDLEPLSPVVNMGIPWALHFAGRREEALIESRRVEELSPGFEEAGNLEIASLESLGRFEEAAAIMKHQMCWGLPADGDVLAQAARTGGTAGYWKARLDTLLPLHETPSGNRDVPDRDVVRPPRTARRGHRIAAAMRSAARRHVCVHRDRSEPQPYSRAPGVCGAG